MNTSTLRKLKDNPHFKPSAKIKAEMDRIPTIDDHSEEEVRAIGNVPIQNAEGTMQRHPTEPRRISQSTKK